MAASGKIGNNSRTTIRGSLDSYLDRYIRFYEGNEILAQFSEFCPERNAVDEFLRSSATLQNQLTGVAVSAKIIGHVRELIFRPIKGVTDSGKWLLQLDLNLEAINEEMRARLKAFDEEGGSISLPKALFKIVSLPEVFGLFSADPEHIESFSLTQIPNDIGAFTFRKTDEENQSSALEHIGLSVVKAGSARIRLENKDAAHACRCTLDLDRNAQTVTFSFTPLILGQNAFAVYQAFAFLHALSKRGNLSLANDQTGIVIIDEVIEGFPSQVKPLQLSLLRKLATIQQKTGRTIVIKREIRSTDIPDIENAVIAVTEGRLYFELEPIIINAKPGENLNHYPRTSGSYVFLPPDKRHMITILDNEIDLGETEIIANSAVFEIEEGSASGRCIPLTEEPFYINFVKYSGERRHPEDVQGIPDEKRN